MQAQFWTPMDLERERGITIKARAVRVEFMASRRRHLPPVPDRHSGSRRLHARSRSPRRLRGCAPVVDAARGRGPRTVANTYLAIENGLELIPVLNKVDLPGAEPERVAAEVSDLIGVDPDDILRISAKTGEGVIEVLEAVVDRIPPPEGDPMPRPGPDLRFRIRPVPRRDRLRAVDGRALPPAREGAGDAERHRGRTG